LLSEVGDAQPMADIQHVLKTVRAAWLRDPLAT
jgi:hypothetical protein